MAFVVLRDIDGKEQLINTDRVLGAERVCNEGKGVGSTTLFIEGLDDLHFKETPDEMRRLFNATPVQCDHPDNVQPSAV